MLNLNVGWQVAVLVCSRQQRHLVVDLVVQLVYSHSASGSDREGGRLYAVGGISASG